MMDDDPHGGPAPEDPQRAESKASTPPEHDPATASDEAVDPEEHHDSQREIREHKLEQMRAEGIEPYPFHFDPDHHVADIRKAHEGLAPDTRTDDRVRVAGRLMLIRRQGGLTFATLHDRTGELQLFVDTKRLGAEVHQQFDDLDRGDWVGVEGTVMTTRRGELSIGVGLVRAAGQGDSPAARQVEGPHRRRDPVPAALRRPDRQRAHPPGLRDPPQRAAGHPRAPRGRGLLRGRGAGAVRPSRAVPRRGRSSPTTTRSTSTCTCGSRWSCTSSG